MWCKSAILASALVAVASGCGSNVTRHVCMGGGAGDNPYLTGAVLLRVDVFGDDAHCDGSHLAAGAGAAIMSFSFAQGQPIELAVAPGPHTLVLTSFADDAGTMPLGQGCTEAVLSPGAQICFDLVVAEAPDFGVDMAVPISCTPSPDDCPTGQVCDGAHCVAGCKSDVDCRGPADAGTSATPLCDPGTHQCVACMGANCTAGMCNGGFAECNGVASDGCECKVDPAAPACCGSGCPLVHKNGWGGNYYACDPLGTPGMSPTTYTNAMAIAAAFSDTDQAGTPSGGWGCTGGNGSDKTFEICKPAGSGNKGACTCWVYDAIGAYVNRIGHTYHSSGVGSDSGCLCPLSTDPTWN